jgi:hypothetical protein
MHFIHNKINQKLEKPTVSLNDFFITYYDAYKREDEKDILYNKIKEKILFLVLIFGMIGTIYYLYDKN